MKKILILSVLLVTVVLSGCATMVRGTKQNLQISSTPSGALASLSNGQACTTPCQLKLNRNQSVLITYRKPGCIPAQLSVYPTLAGSGVILGSIIDYGDGAVYDLVPNPAHAMLICKGSNKRYYQ